MIIEAIRNNSNNRYVSRNLYFFIGFLSRVIHKGYLEWSLRCLMNKPLASVVLANRM